MKLNFQDLTDLYFALGYASFRSRTIRDKVSSYDFVEAERQKRIQMLCKRLRKFLFPLNEVYIDEVVKG